MRNGGDLRKNTEWAGGTRYAGGKPSLVGAPLKGLPKVLEHCLAVQKDGGIWEKYAQAVVDPWGDGGKALAELAGVLLWKAHRAEGGPEDSPWPTLGLLSLARVTEYGAKKYAPLDWHLGQSVSTLLGCLGRHLMKGEAFGWDHPDEESGCSHLAHAIWNVMALLHFEAEGRMEELDDVSPWIGVKAGDRKEEGS